MKLWQTIGFVAVSFGGTLLHFLYDWSNESVFIAPFSGVNESTWEHMKLLYFPLLLFAFIERRFFKERSDFWCVKLAGTLLGLTLIPVLFYTYNGVFGTSPDWINISIFFLAAAAVFLWETRLFNRRSLPCRHPLSALILLLFIGLLFVVFTFFPPHIPLFQDPITGGYGIL